MDACWQEGAAEIARAEEEEKKRWEDGNHDIEAKPKQMQDEKNVQQLRKKEGT
jgi:hypothetical protein